MDFYLPTVKYSRKMMKTPQRLRGQLSKMDESILSAADEDEDNSWTTVRRRSRSSRKTSQATKVYGYSATNRSRVARDACMYRWRFVEVCESVSDVDTTKYPYELVREDRLPDAVECKAELQTLGEQWQHQWLSPTPCQLWQREQTANTQDAFLDCFGSSYMEPTVRALNGVTVKGSLTVKAVFGRNLYGLRTLNADRLYQLDQLRAVRYPRDLQSSWSNVCDDGAPTVCALIEELNRADSVNLEPTRLKLTMRCCLMSRGEPQYAKLTYFREDNKWGFAEVRALSNAYLSHDISLDNSTSFRVKVIDELYEPKKAWWASIEDFVLFDEPDGDPFKTTVSLVGCFDRDLRVEFVTVKWVSRTVNFRGLGFQTSTKKGSTFLQALPPLSMLTDKQPGQTFQFLVSRLVEILDELSERREPLQDW